VIGSGPAGQKAAIAAAKARKHVAVIDRTTMIGGVSVHTGTIPSKTVREAIFQLTGSAVNGNRETGDIMVAGEFGSPCTDDRDWSNSSCCTTQHRRNGMHDGKN